MIFPTIHLNGTSKGDLLEGWLKMSRTLGAALTAMYQEGPNGRDYYIAGPIGLSTAVREHDARIAKVKEAKAEIDAIAEYIADAEGGRP
jgi:hypothetical protein